MSDQHDSDAEILAAAAADDDAFDGVALPDAAETVEPAVLAALDAADAPEPAEGQLWRLAAGPTAPVVLAWIRQVRGPETVAVVPVTLDVAMADDYSLIVAAADNPLGVDLVLHTTAESTVDGRSLLNTIGVLNVADDVAATRNARRSGQPVIGLSVGAPIASVTDERFEYRQQLSESLVPLTAGAFTPDTSDEDPDHDLPSAIDDEVLLGELLSDPQTSLLVEHVLTGLGMGHPEVRLLPAARVVTISEIRMIGDLIDVDEVIRLAGFGALPELSLLSAIAHEVFSLDESIVAMCFAPFDVNEEAFLVNRRTHRHSFTSTGDPVGEANFLAGPVLDVLGKYFDQFVDPFGCVPDRHTRRTCHRHPRTRRRHRLTSSERPGITRFTIRRPRKARGIPACRKPPERGDRSRHQSTRP